ncbi:MAG: helix-turn-helix transcriptional regulator [Acidobacteriota bacterium]
MVLAVLRAYRRVSQRGLARRTGVHHATISQVERGKRTLGEADRQRLLAGLELPERAWETVESLVEWLDWLAERYEAGAPEGGASGAARGAGAIGRDGEERARPDLGAQRREADRLAETAGRERQRQVAELLDFLIVLNS